MKLEIEALTKKNNIREEELLKIRKDMQENSSKVENFVLESHQAANRLNRLADEGEKKAAKYNKHYDDLKANVKKLHNFDDFYTQKVGILEAKLKGVPIDNVDREYRIKEMLKDVKAHLSDPIVKDVRQAAYETNHLAKLLKTDIPNATAEIGKLKLRINQFETTLEKGTEMIKELRKATSDTYSNVARANDDLHLKNIQLTKRERLKAYRERTAHKTRTFTAEEKEVVSAELKRGVRKVVDFCNEWNSLQSGDLFRYKGDVFEVTEEFNPSLRIQHSGQNGTTWEIQKHANAKWGFLKTLGRI
jgi:chromosome segregation ATPase